MSDRRIYVACLAAYNAGVLHGAWIDVDGKTADEIRAETQAMLEASPLCDPDSQHYNPHHTPEEWAIHDHEGFTSGFVGEYSSFSSIADYCEAMENCADEDVLAAFLECFGNVYCDIEEAAEKCNDSYRGKYDSNKQFAEEYALEAELIKEDAPLFGYIDWDHVWNGEFSHDFIEHDGHYFYRNW